MVERTRHARIAVDRSPFGAHVLLLAAAIAIAAILAGCGGSGEASLPNRFDANRAWRLVELQLASGQRPAGSPRLRRLAVKLRPLLPHGRFEALPGEPGLRNVVGTLPGRRPGIVVGAHYDTLASPRGFVGANNGAAGSAIALDYVGNRGLFLPREGTSSEALWSRLVAAANEVGDERFFSREAGPAIEDDHTPFLRAAVPSVDLIDWSYPGHTLADGLDKLSRQSLDAVGETVVQLVSELREE